MSVKNNLGKLALVGLVSLLVACGGAEERKSSYMSKGKAYFEENNIEKARIEFKNVLQIDPKYSNAYYYVGLIEEKDKNFGKAMANYNKAIELDPEYVDPKVKLAKIYTVIGTDEFVEKANKLLAEIFVKAPDNEEAILIDASIEYKTGAKESAVRKIENVVTKHPSLIEGVTLLSSVYMDQGEMEKAVEILEQGVKANPQNIPLKINLAKVYAGQQEIDKAEQQLLQVIKSNPDKYSYRVALFSLYYSTGDLVKAEEVLRKAISDDDEDASRYLLLVDFISKTRSIKDSESELLGAIESKPHLLSLRFAMAKFYEKIGMLDKAKNVLEDIVSVSKYDKDSVKANINLANIFFDEKDFSRASELLAEVREEYPNNPDVLLLKGKLDLVYRNAEDAVNALRSVYNKDPKNSEAAKYLAAAHQLAGQDSLAESVFQKAIQLNPVNPDNHINYANFLINQKRLSEAGDIVDKSLVYFNDNFDLLDVKLKIAGLEKDESVVLSTLEKMKSKFPDKSEPYIKKGQFHMYKKQFSDARMEFEKGMDRSVNKYVAFENIVNTYMAESNSEKAIELVSARIQENKNDSIAYNLLGKIYMSRKNLVDARENFKRAIEFNDAWISPYENLASSYIAEKKIDGAKQVYLQAISKVRNPTSARLRLATLYGEKRENDLAKEQYREIIKISPGHLLAKNNLASLIVDNNPSEEDLKDALNLVNDFEELEHPAFRDTLGWVYYKSGQVQKAVSVLRGVVDRAPEVAIFNYHLGVALNDMEGGAEEAKKYLQQAVDSEQEFVGKDSARILLNS